jgi:DNA (cytosine-5)-methyltransferase 1
MTDAKLSRPSSRSPSPSGAPSRPRLLDLFCKAGGAGMGYHRAGFDVVGVDHEPQPRYPFAFVRADALTFPLEGFDAIHASPPCQANVKGLGAANRALGREYAHADLIAPVRARLRATGLPYVIENVVGAALLAPVQYCGSSFALPIRRHRRFESNVLLLAPACEHDREREKKYWTSYRPGGEVVRSAVVQVYGAGAETHLWGPALGIDWMTPDELTQAIPPAYTEHIGRQLLAYVSLREEAA